jgi:hypothetical protein
MVRMVFDTGYIYVYILYINQLIKLYYYGWLMMNQYFSMVNWITDNKNLNFLMFVIFPHWLVQRMGNLHVGVLLTTPRSSSLEQPLHYCVLYVAVSHSWLMFHVVCPMFFLFRLHNVQYIWNVQFVHYVPFVYTILQLVLIESSAIFDVIIRTRFMTFLSIQHWENSRFQQAALKSKMTPPQCIQMKYIFDKRSRMTFLQKQWPIWFSPL